MADLQKWLNMKWKQEHYNMSNNVTLEQLIEAFKDGKVNFEFEKLDGSLRKMTGTLHEDYLPPEYVDKSIANATESRDAKKQLTALAVWDLDLDDWRSFCLSRLKTLNGKSVTYKG